MSTTLFSRFLGAAERFADRPALVVEGQTLSYAQLRQRALSIAATLVEHRAGEGPPLSCVLGYRTASSFAGILGVSCSGHGYVPLLPGNPAGRLALMIQRSKARALLVDHAGLGVLPDVLDGVPQSMTVLLLDDEVDATLRQRCSRHTLLGASDIVSAEKWTAPQVADDAIAYLLFTSGSTGEPKGVMVAHRNIARFLDVVTQRYGLSEHDRFSHMFETTFDLSLFDLFGPWQNGGCLCCPDARQRMLPAQYIDDAKLTVWFSVPSTALLMQQTRTLEPGSFEGLRLSLFCGEALTVPVAQAWAEAAPRSVVENLYGPTELTLACTLYRLGPQAADEAEGDVVPIGHPFEGMRAKVVDEKLSEVAPGETGELIMAGPQVALGYWRDPERTNAAFVTPPGESEIFYRTGDRVRRPHGDGPLLFLGRLDQQIKIRGHRVELGEIEAAVREEASVSSAVALGWPPAASGGAQGVIAFIDDASVDIARLKKQLVRRLPRHMVPKQIRVIESFPLNPNGKIDRKALRASLQGSSE